MSFVKMIVDLDVFECALARADHLGDYSLNFKQHLQRKNGELQAKLEGSLGEEIVERWLKSNGINFRDDRSEYTHDYSLKEGITLEVKTKVRQVPPNLNYECSIPEYTINMQKANLYVFVSLTEIKNMELSHKKYPEAYIVGVISKSRFQKLARYWPQGSVDPLNGYVIKKSCYNVFIKEMTAPDNFPDIYRGYLNRR
ncbi:hypothetical protein [Pectobacterium versatile]|uniref:hypothetical protein n=1 Tax=Pectobacterium versatile TaxID=2488639 RepID=UPI003830AAEE